uniref:Uncharacterized protein n=1 Tax=Castor canadensis TaxID=51338 RepID=A0A8C0ZV19_CASCN
MKNQESYCHYYYFIYLYLFHSYAMPTKTMEVFRVQDQGSKMVLDSVLTTHERVVQVGTVRELKGYCFSVEESTLCCFVVGFLRNNLRAIYTFRYMICHSQNTEQLH